MIRVSKQDIEDAYNLIANGTAEAAGYRVLIKPLEARQGLESAEKELYSELAKMGFETKTEDQKRRESKGTHHGIVVHVGESAYKAEQLGGEAWVKEGDVAIFDRYAGVEIELPPGSGDLYRFTNDESILGVMKETK